MEMMFIIKWPRINKEIYLLREGAGVKKELKWRYLRSKKVKKEMDVVVTLGLVNPEYDVVIKEELDDQTPLWIKEMIV